MERSDGSGWCLPCGFVEPNETPVEGVVREVREETGLEIKVNQLVGIFTLKPSATMGVHTSSSTNLFRRIAVAGLLTVPPPSNRQILSVALLAFPLFIYVKLLAVNLRHLMKVMR